MPYTHISHIPGHSLGDYQAVADVLGPEPPAGRLALIVGEADGALHIVDVWDSKAHADHFAAERLMPAFQQAGVKPGPEETYIEFDTNVLELGARLRNRLPTFRSQRLRPGPEARSRCLAVPPRSEVLAVPPGNDRLPRWLPARSQSQHKWILTRPLGWRSAGRRAGSRREPAGPATRPKTLIPNDVGSCGCVADTQAGRWDLQAQIRRPAETAAHARPSWPGLTRRLPWDYRE